MLMYFLIGLSLVLVGVVGLQFSYMFYVDRVYRDRRKYLRDLEQRHARLTDRLSTAEQLLAEQERIIARIEGDREEVWADIIEER